MNRILTAIIILVLITSFTAGCDSNALNTLEDTKWLLRSYGEQSNLRALIDGTEITAIFNSDKNEATGSAGCNTYFAKYEADSDNLFMSEMAFTEMACLSPKGIMEQEQDFLSILRNAQSFEVDYTTLTIFCSRGQQLYFTTTTR